MCFVGDVSGESVKFTAKETSFPFIRYGHYIRQNLDRQVRQLLAILRELKHFRIMKSEFKARPVFLSNEDRIEAHFLTCFISLLIYRLLEKKLGGKYTCCEIIDSIREMNLHESKGNGYIPSYKRTDFTDDLHDAFGFRTDYEIVTTKQMKNIFKITKNK